MNIRKDNVQPTYNDLLFYLNNSHTITTANDQPYECVNIKTTTQSISIAADYSHKSISTTLILQNHTNIACCNYSKTDIVFIGIIKDETIP